MIIETERLILRTFTESDAADAFEYLHEPTVHCFACMKTPTLEDAKKAVLERAKDEEYYFAITLRENGKVIGEIDAMPETHAPDEANAVRDTFSPCWMLNPEYQGKGYAYEAAHAFFDYLFTQKGARPNAIVTVVALYDKAQTLPLPDMYGKNLTFKTGGVDGCDCEETLRLIAEGKLDTEPLITHTYPLSKIDEAYELFENKRDGVIKVAVEC